MNTTWELLNLKGMSLWFGGLYLNIKGEVLEPRHRHDLHVTSDNKCGCSSRSNVHPERMEFNLLQMTPVCSGFHRLLSVLL